MSKLKTIIQKQKTSLKKSFKLRQSTGYITITVLILMMVLMSIIYLFASAVFSELTIARNNKAAQAAFALAEAGVQEAIYKVQYDTTAQNYFLAGSPDYPFSHPAPALLTQGSYEVTIDNTAPGVATITSIGHYAMGLRTATREIKLDIAQATEPPEYPYDGGIYASGSGAGSSIADIDFWSAVVNIYGGSLLSNRDINLKFGANVDIEETVEAGDDVTKQHSSVLDCNCLINDDGDPLTPQCSPSPGCAPLENAPAKTMPQIDFEAYKTIAQNTPGPSPDGNQYFSDGDDFEDLIPFLGSQTFNGVVYVDDGIDLLGETVNMNGVLVASESIKLHAAATINIAPPPGGGASGILTQKNFEIMATSRFGGTGLIYTGDRFEHYTMTDTTNLTGGIISRRTWFWGSQTTNIYFDANVINTVLGNPTDTPVIEINHWEEEY